MSKKCDLTLYNGLAEQLKRFSLYEDLKELYDKVIPPLVQV